MVQLVIQVVSSFSISSSPRLDLVGVCLAKLESQDRQKHPEGGGGFLLGWYLSTATFVFKLNSKVACSICVAGAVFGGSGAEVVQISVGISLPLTILLICILGLLSTSLIFFFL